MNYKFTAFFKWSCIVLVLLVIFLSVSGILLVSAADSNLKYVKITGKDLYCRALSSSEWDSSSHLLNVDDFVLERDAINCFTLIGKNEYPDSSQPFYFSFENQGSSTFSISIAGSYVFCFELAFKFDSSFTADTPCYIMLLQGGYGGYASNYYALVSNDGISWSTTNQNSACVFASVLSFYSENPNYEDPSDSTDTTDPVGGDHWYGAEKPVWSRSLSVSYIPCYSLGGNDVIYNVLAYVPEGEIYYKWYLSGQDFDGNAYPFVTVEYISSLTGSTFTFSPENPGIYMLTCQAQNRCLSPETGELFYSDVISCTTSFMVDVDGTDSVAPEASTPPYDGWEDDKYVADDFNDSASDKVDELQEGIGILDEVTMPNVDDIDINILDMIDGRGFTAMNTVLGVLWDNNVILSVLTFAFVFGMIAYFIFGKK